MAYFLGIDTSAYTTSVAVAKDGEIVYFEKKLLDVKNGERGLRQSDAFFMHVNRLPELLEGIGKFDYKAIGVSAFPRDCEGSYMPVFRAGESLALSLGKLLGVPVYRFSHQKGHVVSAAYSAGCLPLLKSRINAFHVSGGTTEILLSDRLEIKRIGGSRDLNAGQAIDRVGVSLGLPFPSGKYLEELAKNGKPVKKPKICVDKLECSLSGLENLAAGLIKEGESRENTAYYTLDFIKNTLDALSENLRKEYGLPILYAGGVMSNSMIKDCLKKRDDVYFAEPRFSSDNAAGAALLAYFETEGYIDG